MEKYITRKVAKYIFPKIQKNKSVQNEHWALVKALCIENYTMLCLILSQEQRLKAIKINKSVQS